jgi:hypothetical protein
LDSRGTSTWKDTALETTSVTSGTSPPAQARAKDVEPWQWTIALSVLAPVSRRTVAMSAGWS